MFRRCPYCHHRVLRWFYEAHEKKHTRRRPDGQMTDYMTARPEERFSGPLDDVPQNYRHIECGVVTRMPEAIIRTYLVNPMSYSDGSFCCGCGDHVDSSRLVWEETGENVLDYMGRLRLKYLRSTLGMRPVDRPAGIILTTRAEQKIRRILRSLGEEAVLVLGFPKPGKTGFKLDAAATYDQRSKIVVNVSGIPIAVRRKHRKHISGIVIDYLELPQDGFAIVRLYAMNYEE